MPELKLLVLTRAPFPINYILHQWDYKLPVQNLSADPAIKIVWRRHWAVPTGQVIITVHVHEMYLGSWTHKY